MATIRDVARASGVSTATVSHVLNGKDERVSASTRERVLAAVRELRYKPTALEERQKAILTRNLGLMVGNLTRDPLQHNYFAQALNGALEICGLKGFTLSIFVEKMWDDFGHTVRRSYDGRCDGLIYVAPDLNSEVIVSLQARGTPMVLIGTTAWLPSVASVDIDNAKVGQVIANQFLEQGHQRFAFIGASHNHASSLEREQAFQKALMEAQPPGFVYRCLGHGQRHTTAEEALDIILALPENERPTAIFAWHDAEAVALIQLLRDRGFRVPDDFSVAGVDDMAESKDVGLTTIENPAYILGKRAANLLIEHALDHTLPNEVILLPTNLIKRDSIGPAPKDSVQKPIAIGSNGGSK